MEQRPPTFSKEGYAEVLVNATAKGYRFIPFAAKDVAGTGDKMCLMRHDVDTSLKCALEMGEIEYKNGIQSTYFFMLRSPGYNLFSRYAFAVLNKIKEMGHEIALHFDAAHPAVGGRDLVDVVGSELRILADLAEAQIHAVSFHQPSAAILKGDLLIPGVINTYHNQQMREWYYTSDSNRVWKEYNALSVFDSQRFNKIQVLVHPIWWIYNDKMIEDAWDNAVMDNFYIMQQQFLDTEGAYGRRREFTITR